MDSTEPFEPYDPDQPLVCFDEHPKQLLKQVEQPRPAEPGTVAREDYQYERNGSKNLFLAAEPLAAGERSGLKIAEPPKIRYTSSSTSSISTTRMRIASGGAGQPQHAQSGSLLRVFRANRSASLAQSSKELRKHVRDPLPGTSGAVARTDHHYERNGKRMLHVATEPLTGRCHLHVTERQRTCEWLDCMVAIASDYPDAVRIRVVLDNLSTHNPLHSTASSRLKKHASILIDSSFTTRPHTEVG